MEFLRLPGVEYIPLLEELRGLSGALHTHVTDKRSHLNSKDVVAASGREEDELDVAVRAAHSEPVKCKLHRRLVEDSAGVGFGTSCRTL